MNIINQASEIINFQEAFDEMIRNIEKISKNEEPERVWLLQHEEVYTIGKSGGEEDILDKSINFLHTNRGGKVTFHGPGQLIVYFMLDIKKRFGGDVRKYIGFLQKSVIDTLQSFGIESEADTDLIGVWVKNGERREKIASIGVRISHGISYHGVSINISPDLEKFGKIIPCGISDFGVCSVRSLGFDIGIEEFAEGFIGVFIDVIQAQAGIRESLAMDSSLCGNDARYGWLE